MNITNSVFVKMTMAHTKFKVGDRFGKLVVLKRLPNKGKYTSFLCRCDCGVEKPRIGPALRQAKSCGCLRIEHQKTLHCYRRLEPGESAARCIFYSNRKGALQRGISFDLTEAEFKEIAAKDCVYCGAPPSNATKEIYGQYGTYAYNGLDRTDNRLGYSTANCVSCCWQCNNAKGTSTVAEFISWLESIHNVQHNHGQTIR